MKRDHGGAPEARIDASVNVNPFGPPPALDAVFGRARELAARYPQIDARSAREAWAARCGVEVENLLVGNGASEMISLVVRALGPRRLVVFDPCYSEYEAAARAIDVPIAHLPLELADDTWRTPASALDAVGSGDLVVVGQPNNPTGHLTDTETLLGVASTGAHLLVDESFLELARAFAPHAASLAPHVGDRITVVSSLTKTFCVPGLRLGILIGQKDLADRISDLRDPWSVNGIAAEAGVVLADATDYLDASRALLAAERARIATAFAAIPGLRSTTGVVPWLLAELPADTTAAAFRAQLLDRGIAVRDASTFAALGERWIRIAVRTPAENDAVIAAVTDALA